MNEKIDCSSCSFKACVNSASCENCTGFQEIKENAFYRDYIASRSDFFDLDKGQDFDGGGD